MPKGVYFKTKEHRLNLSKAHLGKNLSPETRKRISESKKGIRPKGLDRLIAWNRSDEGRKFKSKQI